MHYFFTTQKYILYVYYANKKLNFDFPIGFLEILIYNFYNLRYIKEMIIWR